MEDVFFVGFNRIKCCTARIASGMGLPVPLDSPTFSSNLKGKGSYHVLLLICNRVRDREIDNACLEYYMEVVNIIQRMYKQVYFNQAQKPMAHTKQNFSNVISRLC